MDRELLRYLISSGVLTAVLIAIVQFVLRWLENRRDKAASQPKSDAEVRRTEAEYDEMVARTQRDILAGWQRELDYRDRRIKDLQTKIFELETHLAQIDRTLEDAHEQERILTEELDECRRMGRDLMRQREILIAHLKKVEEWMSRHTDVDDPAPVMRPFDADST